ncbi:hypothetical protein BJ742DRAFT_849068 [Cladochytrium replicatum]|nr:hypothetical protein BJ742DRAFT_849068 [Cladochytrium replicatum]
MAEPVSVTASTTQVVSTSQRPSPSAPPSVPEVGLTNDGTVVVLVADDLVGRLIHSLIFGMLILWAAYVLYVSITLWVSRRKKPIYVLNVLQALFYMWKIIAASMFQIFMAGAGPFQPNCSVRGPVIVVPQLICFQLIYGIMLMKLLLFTPYIRTAQVFYCLAMGAHFSCVIAGLAQRRESLDMLGFCRTTYSVVFKQQYIVEAIVEVVTAGLLLHGMVYRTGNLVAGTQEIFRQLRSNEHLRVFLVGIFIIIKIFFTYVPLPVVTSISFTHAVDSARSALVCWALEREKRSVARAVGRPETLVNRNTSKQPSSSPQSPTYPDEKHSRKPTGLSVLAESTKGRTSASMVKGAEKLGKAGDAMRNFKVSTLGRTGSTRISSVVANSGIGQGSYSFGNGAILSSKIDSMREDGLDFRHGAIRDHENDDTYESDAYNRRRDSAGSLENENAVPHLLGLFGETTHGSVPQLIVQVEELEGGLQVAEKSANGIHLSVRTEEPRSRKRSGEDPMTSPNNKRSKTVTSTSNDASDAAAPVIPEKENVDLKAEALSLEKKRSASPDTRKSADGKPNDQTVARTGDGQDGDIRSGGRFAKETRLPREEVKNPDY